MKNFIQVNSVYGYHSVNVRSIIQIVAYKLKQKNDCTWRVAMYLQDDNDIVLYDNLTEQKAYQLLQQTEEWLNEIT